jgi:hypothetical protein
MQNVGEMGNVLRIFVGKRGDLGANGKILLK